MVNHGGQGHWVAQSEIVDGGYVFSDQAFLDVSTPRSPAPVDQHRLCVIDLAREFVHTNVVARG